MSRRQVVAAVQLRRTTRLRYPGGFGAAMGAGAFLTGYLAVGFATRGSLRALLAAVVVERRTGAVEPLTAMLGPGALPPLRATALVTLNAHLVPLRASHPDGGVVVANPLLAGDHSFAWLALVPPVLLAAAGVASTATADGPTALRYDLFVGRVWTRYAFNGGTLVALGYFPFAFVVALFVTVDGARTMLTVDLLRTWIQVGLIYPFAFGGLGGAFASWYWRRSSG